MRVAEGRRQAEVDRGTHTGRKKLEKSHTLGHLSLASSSSPGAGSRPGGGALWTQGTHCSVKIDLLPERARASGGHRGEGQSGLQGEGQPDRLGSRLTYIYLLVAPHLAGKDTEVRAKGGFRFVFSAHENRG